MVTDWGSQLPTGIGKPSLSRKEPSFIDIKGIIGLFPDEIGM
jgi:hypothetical protein